MKITVFFFNLFFLFGSSLYSQSGYLELIEKGKYATVEKKLKKAILKNPTDVGVNYTYAILNTTRNYKNYDPYSAYNYLQTALISYKSLNDQKEIKSLNKVPINLSVFESTLNFISENAFNDASSKNSVGDYDNFLNHFVAAPSLLLRQAIEKRNEVAFNAVAIINTVESYQSFIVKYPEAIQVPKAILKRNELIFQDVRKIDQIPSYKNFILKYPDAVQVNLATERIHELAFSEASKLNTATAFNGFLVEYPLSKEYSKAYQLFEQLQFSENTVAGDLSSYKNFYNNFSRNTLVNIALDSIFSIAKRRNDIPELEYYISKATGSKRKEALVYYHDIYTDDGERKTLDAFFAKYNDGSLSELKEKDYQLSSFADDLKMEFGYREEKYQDYDYYIKNAAPKERAFVALQKLISGNVVSKNWSNALNQVNEYLPYFSQNPGKVENLFKLLESKYDNSIKVIPFGPEINTKEGGEYIPVVTADGKTMYFCGRDRKDNLGGEDIYSVNLKNRSAAKVVTELSSSYKNEAPVSISIDGNKMILFINGKLNFSEKTVLGWSSPVELPQQINSGSWQADAMISNDGKALLFSSIRKGNFDYYTDNNPGNYHAESNYAADIYVSLKDDNGEWGEPINLGSSINTMYCDRSPFLHPDMKTLYFSSSGRGGLGTLDVFKSTRLYDTCWNCWSEPINLGKEINTPENDWTYLISTNGEKAYFSQNQSPTENKNNIFSINLPMHLRPDLVATISGNLLDRSNKPINAEIFWEDLESGKNIGKSKSNPVDGSYFIVLPLGKIYGYYVDKDEYFPVSSNIDLRKKDKAVDMENAIEMITFQEMIDEGLAVPINNLFFDFGKFELLSYSIPELKRMASIIKKSDLKIEIDGHTDNIGEEKDNQILSERRANAVLNFLVNEGCDAKKMNVIGHGETKPVATNNTDSGRAKNRRVELRFVK